MSKRVLIALVVGLFACGGKKDSSPAPEAAPPASWTLISQVPELPCQDDDTELSYNDGLRRGRALGREERWGEAVTALEAALAARKDDVTALSELSWAAFKAGDHEQALSAGQKVATLAEKPEQKAAGLYNAGRAAEAMGDTALAKTHYEESLALRPSDPVQKRLAGLGKPAAPRAPDRAEPPGVCSGLATVDAVCACLRKELGPDGAWNTADASGGCTVSGPLVCSAGEHRGAGAVVLEVQGRQRDSAGDDDSTVIPGMYLVLVLARGTGWSATALLETVPDTDMALIPRGGFSGAVQAMHENPFGDGTLVWVQSQSRLSDAGMGEESVSESTSLTVCVNPKDVSRPATCHAMLLSEIEYTHGGDTCQVRDTSYVFRATLNAAGQLGLVLVYGKDSGSRAGLYAL